MAAERKETLLRVWRMWGWDGKGGDVDVAGEGERDDEVGGNDLNEVVVDEGPEGEAGGAIVDGSDCRGREDEEGGVECWMLLARLAGLVLK